MRCRWTSLTASAAMLLAVVAPARALTVFDPTNYAQNILQATRALEQIHNQISQIEQQAQMLARNPLQLSPQLSASIQQAHALFQSAQGIAFDIHQVGDQIKTLYPDTWDQMKLGDMLARSDQWMAEDRANLERAMRAEAQAAQAVDESRGRIDQALNSSAGAQGQTSAIQASNQLLGVTASQLAEIQALLVAQSRALTTERLERAAREQRGQEIQRRAFPMQSTGELPPARTAF